MLPSREVPRFGQAVLLARAAGEAVPANRIAHNRTPLVPNRSAGQGNPPSLEPFGGCLPRGPSSAAATGSRYGIQRRLSREAIDTVRSVRATVSGSTLRLIVTSLTMTSLCSTP